MLAAKVATVIASSFEYIRQLLSYSITYDEDDSDDDEDTLLIGTCKEAEMRIIGERERPARVEGYVDITVPQYRPEEFKGHFRMWPETANELENLLSRNLLPVPGEVGRPPTPPRVQILATLWLLATPESYRSVGDRFGLAKSTFHACVDRVVKELCDIAPNVITWPEGDRLAEIKAKFNMPNCVGAVDGTFIPINGPKGDSLAYRTRKKNHAIILQVTCDKDLVLTDAYAGWPGSVGDARVFRNSDLFRQAGTLFHDDEYIIGDKAYPCLPWCIPPYKKDARRNPPLTPAQQFFNTFLSQDRSVIERAICLLKGRWRRLKHRLDMQRIEQIPFVILACCVLHNLCLTGLIPDVDLDYIAEGAQEVEDGEQAGQQGEFVGGNVGEMEGDEAGFAKRNRLRYLLTGE